MNRINCTTAKKKDDNLSKKNPPKILTENGEHSLIHTHKHGIYSGTVCM